VGRDGFQIEQEALGLGMPPKGRNSSHLCKQLSLGDLRHVPVPFGYVIEFMPRTT